MKTLITAALLGSVAAGGIAYAQVAAPTAAAKPMRGDVDADGRITRAEYVRQAEARFVTLDVNRDGSLTRDEARSGRGAGGKRGGMRAIAQDGAPPPAGDRMRGPGGRGGPGGGMLRLDTDGDGRVTRAEYNIQSATRFAGMDANRDGTVDATEMAAMPGGGRMAGRMGGRADADGSGTLTRAEFDAQAGQRFARMDMNGDDVIDAAELKARPMGRGGARRGAGPASPTPPAPTGA